MAAYRMVRRSSACGALSVDMFAEGGITAGSRLAVIELRALLLGCLDDAAARFPDAPLGIYIDDANQNAAGPAHRVADSLFAATLALALARSASAWKC